MAEGNVKNPAETFEKPSTASAASGPILFTMPLEYRHGGMGKAIHVPKPPVSSATSVPQSSPNPPIPKPPLPPTLKKPRTVSRPLLIGGGVFIILLLAGALAVVFWPKETSTPVVTTPRTPPPVTRPVTETPEPVVETPEPVAETPFPKATVPGTDTDSDGLTDLEERTIYGTDPRLPDSDADGFLDGNEVFHRYNPNGTAPGTLLESGLVRAFPQAAIPAFNLPATRLLYPAGWATSGDYPEAQFKAVTGETVTYALLKKDAPEQTLVAWKDLYGTKDVFVPSVTKNGYPTLVAENQLIAYVDLGSSVGVLSYSTGIKGTVDYLQSFQMMTNSLETTP